MDWRAQANMDSIVLHLVQLLSSNRQPTVEQMSTPAASMEPCALWVLLLRKFAIGKLSAVEVQELASA